MKEENKNTDLHPKEEKDSVHKGRRERVRNDFLNNGLDRFEPHVVLEFLLYYAIPLRDTNPIAHNLLSKFGSLSAVFDAPFEELLQVEGVGRQAASLIKMIPQICRKYLEDLDSDKTVIFSYNEAGKHLIPKFIGRQNEAVALMLLDSKSRVLFCDIVDEGSATAANLYIKNIVKLAVRYNAVYALLSHNHPSGSCLPSKQDLDTTEWVFNALKTVEVRLIDHIIVSGRDYISLANSGILPNLFGPETE